MIYRMTMSFFRAPAPTRPATNQLASAKPLTNAEEAVWGDPELLARIEAVLDDPSLAVALDETALNPNTATDRTDTPSGRPEP